MEERTKKTLEECKRLELKLTEAEKEKRNLDKKYAQVMWHGVCDLCGNNLTFTSQTTITRQADCQSGYVCFEFLIWLSVKALLHDCLRVSYSEPIKLHSKLNIANESMIHEEVIAEE